MGPSLLLGRVPLLLRRRVPFRMRRSAGSGSSESDDDHSVSLCHSCVSHHVVSARSGADSHRLYWDLRKDGVSI